MIKLLKAGGKVFGYILEAFKPLAEEERAAAWIILPHEYQAIKNEYARKRAEKWSE